MATATLAYDYLVAMAAAIRTAITAADPNGAVLVDSGYPTNHADDMILLIELDATQASATLGTNRTREEVIDLQVHFCSRRGDQDEANEAAYSLLKLVERHCRMTDPTLGDVMREVVLTKISSRGYTLEDDLGTGRLCEAIATFTGKQRVSA
jgi:hypothetical protein